MNRFVMFYDSHKEVFLQMEITKAASNVSNFLVFCQTDLDSLFLAYV